MTGWIIGLFILWVGFIIGYVTCALLALMGESPLWSGEDHE